MSFTTLALRPRLLDAVSEMGYTRPTQIQREAIPYILDGRDVVGCAQTGTGKTAAFILPTLHHIKPGSGLKALVVTPTRELAQQIGDVAREAARFSRHRVAEVYGGVGYEPQLKKLRRGVDIVIATPGRLLDIHERGEIDLSGVEVLVLDEADRMLDMGFLPDVRRIIRLLPERRQNLLFSATMSSGVLSVVRSTLNDPVHIETTPSVQPVDGVEQVVYPVSSRQKSDLLVNLLEEQHLERVLVFTRTKHRADRVFRVLSRAGISSSSIHGGRTQAQRQKALDSFKAGHTRVLVATDVVARGIDVYDISHVINYDVPNTPEDYVHRIGRTARAGATGSAITFLAAEETVALHDIERRLGQRIECRDHDGFDYSADRIVPMADRNVSTKPRALYSGGVMRGRARSRRGRSGRGTIGARK
ncbi:MAG: DEAD/DEAH box helicase [Coriobacteriia bacterium]|nr:DEAD/DEAH box helicase [Coriobacteriia bacterium]